MCFLPPPRTHRRNSFLAPRRSRAFTLLEIMLVVAIIALLLAAGFNQFGDVMGHARETVAQTDIQTLEQKLKLYEATNGFLPTTEQGLQALVTLPQSEPRPMKWYQLMDKLPKDPWQQDYVYSQPGAHNTQGFDLYTKGKDRVAGTADDIGNWEVKQ